MKSFTFFQSDAAFLHSKFICLLTSLRSISHSNFLKRSGYTSQLPAQTPTCSALHWVSSEQLAASLYPVQCLPLSPMSHTLTIHMFNRTPSQHQRIECIKNSLNVFLTIPVTKKHVSSLGSLKLDPRINAYCILRAPLRAPANYLTNLPRHVVLFIIFIFSRTYGIKKSSSVLFQRPLPRPGKGCGPRPLLGTSFWPLQLRGRLLRPPPPSGPPPRGLRVTRSLAVRGAGNTGITGLISLGVVITRCQPLGSPRSSRCSRLRWVRGRCPQLSPF